MQYLIQVEGEKPFFTKWFEFENNWRDDVKMVVFDLVNHEYSDDGETWQEIEFDHL